MQSKGLGGDLPSLSAFLKGWVIGPDQVRERGGVQNKAGVECRGHDLLGVCGAKLPPPPPPPPPPPEAEKIQHLNGGFGVSSCTWESKLSRLFPTKTTHFRE